MILRCPARLGCRRPSRFAAAPTLGLGVREKVDTSILKNFKVNTLKTGSYLEKSWRFIPWNFVKVHILNHSSRFIPWKSLKAHTLKHVQGSYLEKSWHLSYPETVFILWRIVEFSRFSKVTPWKILKVHTLKNLQGAYLWNLFEVHTLKHFSRFIPWQMLKVHTLKNLQNSYLGKSSKVHTLKKNWRYIPWSLFKVHTLKYLSREKSGKVKLFAEKSLRKNLRELYAYTLYPGDPWGAHGGVVEGIC